MEGRLEPTETQAQVRPDLQLQPAVGRGRVLREGSEGQCPLRPASRWQPLTLPARASPVQGGPSPLGWP